MSGRRRRVAFGVAWGLLCGLTYGWMYMRAVGPWATLLIMAICMATALRLLLWPSHVVITWLVGAVVRFRLAEPRRAVVWLPFRHHDLIYLPLPGLRSILLQLADIDPELCQELIAEATDSIGQKRAARLALVELQARALDEAARSRLFTRAAELDLPFLKLDGVAQDSSFLPIHSFQSAAKDLIAGGHNQRRRRSSLARAHGTIERFQTTTAAAARPSPLALRLLPTAALWLHVIREEQAKLAREAIENPEVPAAFVAGAPLTPADPEDRTLFKGRTDVIELIEHDLAPERRGVLLVFGQRRMGKTSFLNYLPTYLGTGTFVVPVGFSSLSGEPHRETPHRVALAAVAAANPGFRAPPDSPRWGDALTWLRELDATLEGRSLLIVIDEVERVEEGIREGWCTTDFLDFLRAAGDALRRIRFLLLTAYPLHRLGDHWVDHLVSATSRSISYLAEPDARDLMQHPIPDFPDIYPEGGVDRILAETACHPYLLQKVGDELCRLLNAAHRQKATVEDLEKAFDAVISGTNLFDELWRQRNDDERASLRRMAAAPGPIEPDPAARDLVRQGFAVKGEAGKVSIAVPLFREWIAETKGA